MKKASILSTFSVLITGIVGEHHISVWRLSRQQKLQWASALHIQWAGHWHDDGSSNTCLTSCSSASCCQQGDSWWHWTETGTSKVGKRGNFLPPPNILVCLAILLCQAVLSLALRLCLFQLTNCSRFLSALVCAYSNKMPQAAEFVGVPISCRKEIQDLEAQVSAKENVLTALIKRKQDSVKHITVPYVR